MSLPLSPPLAPMEAEPLAALPSGEGWQYEPKWDGFRCLAFKDGDAVYLQSKSGQPLARYFPDVVADVARLSARRLVLDGELCVEIDGVLSFADLQLRLHPAASRVNKLAALHPARYVVFDLLVDARGRDLRARPLHARRAALEALALGAGLSLSPTTRDRRLAERWLAGSGADLDGVIAKLARAPYDSGGRGAMIKVKRWRSADCVVGGFRWGAGTRTVGSLLLGLYDDEGRLHNVGFTSSFDTVTRRALADALRPLMGPPDFTGAAPGGPSRWSKGRVTAYEPLRPELVVEVSFDHFTGGRFRHGTRLLRLRPDKAPSQCTLEQVRPPRASLDALSSLLAAE